METLRWAVPSNKEEQAEALYNYRVNVGGFISIQEAQIIAPDLILTRIRLTGEAIECIEREEDVES